MSVNEQQRPGVVPTGDWRQDLGPLRPLFQDPTVTEIMVNAPDCIFVEKNGVVSQVDARFANMDALWKLIQSIVVAGGKELNRKIPVVDLRLPDGSRANCIIPPASVDSPILTIRKFMMRTLTYENLLKNEMFDSKILYFLNRVVLLKQNLIVSGGTGSGKTTLLNLLGTFVPSEERLVTIEDTPELNIAHKNIVRLESRPPKAQDPGISIQELLRASLRVRPDRIIVGECRGPEAFDMIQAMNTGHDGSMATLHSNSCADVPRRLEGMILRSEGNLNPTVLREDILGTISLIIQCSRSGDGKRRVVEIAETLPDSKDGQVTQTLFVYDSQKGFHSVGVTPHFVDQIKEAQILFPKGFFDPAHVVRLSA